MKNFAFVFARGGSKGVKRKNVRDLCGSPLLAYAIRLAQSMDEIAEVFVSTDDDEIATVAQHEGARVIRRPAKFASDTADEWSAWRHAIEYVDREFGKFDRFISLPCTSPLRNAEDVRRCLAQCDDTAEIVVSMVKTQRSPWFNMVKEDDAGLLSLLVDSGATITRRQDAPHGFDLTTVAYVAHPGFVAKAQGIWDGRVKGVIIPEERCIDIDTELDFLIAEFMMRRQKVIVDDDSR